MVFHLNSSFLFAKNALNVQGMLATIGFVAEQYVQFPGFPAAEAQVRGKIRTGKKYQPPDMGKSHEINGTFSLAMQDALQAIYVAPVNMTALLLVAAGYIESSAYDGIWFRRLKWICFRLSHEHVWLSVVYKSSERMYVSKVKHRNVTLLVKP